MEAFPLKKGRRAAQVAQRWGFSVQFYIETPPEGFATA